VPDSVRTPRNHRLAGNDANFGASHGLVGAVGAWLAWNTAGLALGLLGVSTGGGLGFGIMVGAAVVGGLNGTISGMTRIYDWASPTGWLSFLADSTWGLAGTAMSDLLNIFYKDRNYRPELSERQNRHVYDGGFGFGTYAFTQGNVTSNLNGRHGDLLDHPRLAEPAVRAHLHADLRRMDGGRHDRRHRRLAVHRSVDRRRHPRRRLPRQPLGVVGLRRGREPERRHAVLGVSQRATSECASAWPESHSGSVRPSSPASSRRHAR